MNQKKRSMKGKKRRQWPQAMHVVSGHKQKKRGRLRDDERVGEGGRPGRQHGGKRGKKDHPPLRCDKRMKIDRHRGFQRISAKSGRARSKNSKVDRSARRE